jgi:hypothetical protein
MQAAFRQFVGFGWAKCAELQSTLRVARHASLRHGAGESASPLVGLHLAVIADEYDIEIEPDLAQILPPGASAGADPSFLPGWDEPL